MTIFITEKSEGYELLDSGDGEKLERFGDMVLRRPDPQVLWKKSLGEEKWSEASATFERGVQTGKWHKKEGVGDEWSLSFNSFIFSLKLLPSKHTGLFPEQSQNWNWLAEKVKSRKLKVENVSILNLFGYTGGATMAALSAGASVCHVDASKFVVDAASKNLEASGLRDKPVRFIVDDVRKFIEREIKRGVKYDVIVLDPPVYGKGADGEIWKIEEDLAPLLSRLKNLLSAKPLAVLLNGYASGYSALAYGNLLSSTFGDMGGEVSSGELCIKETSGQRLLPCGIFARLEFRD